MMVQAIAAAAAVLLLTAVTVGSLLPSHRMPGNLPNDKLLHFGGYGAVAAALLIALPGWPIRVASLAVLFGIGWLVEVLQPRLSARRYSWHDLWANGIGILAAATLVAVVEGL